jgi:hypothetical protein
MANTVGGQIIHRAKPASESLFAINLLITPHTEPASVDNLVSAGDQPGRDFEAERFSSLEVDYQL